MRIAVISDVHGNAFALEAVLKDLHAQSPDLIVNLGDQVHGKANPGRAFELQHGLGATEVLGSAEPFLTQDDPTSVWLKSQLSEEAIQHLLNLPLTLSVLDGEVLLCHGDLQASSGHLLWSWQRGPYLTRGFQDLREHLSGVTARVILSGHTHREGLTAIDDHLVINAGAVSHQVDGDPRARWTLLEKRNGRWLPDFRRVNYDQKEAARWVLSHAPDPGEEAELLMKGGD